MMGGGGLNISLPKSPDWRLVVTNNMTLQNPLSPNSASVAKVAAEGTWSRGTHQAIHRTTVKGTIRMQYTNGYLRAFSVWQYKKHVQMFRDAREHH